MADHFAFQIFRFLGDLIKSDIARFEEAGIPKSTARMLGRLPIAGLIPDILYAATNSKKPLDQAAKAFFSITDLLRIGRMVQAARDIETSDYYDGLALGRALQSLHRARRDIVEKMLLSAGSKSAKSWTDLNAEMVDSTRDQINHIVDHEQATVSRLTVAANILADLARI